MPLLPSHKYHPDGIAFDAPDHKTTTPDGTAPADVTYPAPLVMFALFNVIFAVPSKEAPEIVLAVASLVAVAAFPLVLADIEDGKRAELRVPDPILLALILVRLEPDPLNVPAVTVFEKAL